MEQLLEEFLWLEIFTSRVLTQLVVDIPAGKSAKDWENALNAVTNICEGNSWSRVKSR